MIGDIIRRKRRDAGLSQVELGRLINVDHRTISSYETNRTEPSIGMIEKLADALRCQKSELVGDVYLLTRKETDLVKKFRLLDEAQKDAVLMMVAAFDASSKKAGVRVSAS